MTDNYLEKTVMAGWQFLTGDVDFMTYGGKWVRQTGDSTYHVIKLVNMLDATGDDTIPVYSVELAEVDLNIAPIERALSCCGWTLTDVDETEPPLIVEAVSSYGCYAPMGNWAGNNYRQLLADAKRESRMLTDDSRYHYTRMNRPVNRLGSTACEYAHGDFTSAMIRGIASGDVGARIIGKVHGLKESDLDDIASEPMNRQLSFTCGGF